MVLATMCSTRRLFLAGSASLSAVAGAASMLGQGAQTPTSSGSAQSTSGSTPPPPKPPSMPRTAPPYDKNTINLIGPKSGYSPHIGTIVTMLTWMELAVLGPTRGLKQQDLDFLFDKMQTPLAHLCSISRRPRSFINE